MSSPTINIIGALKAQQDQLKRLLDQKMCVPPRRNPLRKDSPKLPCRRHSRSHHLMIEAAPEFIPKPVV